MTINKSGFARIVVLALLFAAVGAVAGTLASKGSLKLFYLRQRAIQRIKFAPQVVAASSTPHHYQEYTIVVEGVKISTATQKLTVGYQRLNAQRADGVRVEEHVPYLNGGQVRRRQVLYPDGGHVYVVPEMRIKTTATVPRGSLFTWATQLSPDSDCTSRRETFLVDGKRDAVSKFAGFTTMQGFTVAKVISPTGSTLYFVPSLDCASFGQDDTNRTPDKDHPEPGVITRIDLVSVVHGTPSADLFSVSAYKEVAPSYLWAESNARAVLLAGGTAEDAQDARNRILTDPSWQAKDQLWKIAQH